MEMVTFTCTAPGTNLRWSISDVFLDIDIDPAFTPFNMPLMTDTVPPYTFTLIAFDNISLTSTLSRIAENGITVICLNPRTSNNFGSETIQLAGEVLCMSLTVLHMHTLPTQFLLLHLKEPVTLLRAVQQMKLV